MHFALSEDQAALAEIAQDYLGLLPDGRAVADGHDPRDLSPWARLVEEQAWQALAIPEAHGGFGFGWLELAITLEATGRRLTPCPLLGIGMATGVLLETVASGARDEALEAIAGGEVIPMVWRSPAPHLAGARRAVFVQGDACFVAPLATREACPSLDPCRPLDRVMPDLGKAVPLEVDLQRARSRASVLLAWEAVGVAQACLDMAVAYAKLREQYGKAIGSFQAIQHLCADVFVAVESARSAAWYAAWAVDERAPDAPLAAHTAIALAQDAAFKASAANIQIHGGIGFTWEHDAHLYFKRARGSRDLLGSPRDHRHAVADHLLGAK
jgi:alkylation response protein AidB-like acyl-CoA dehydrogenase